MPMKIVDEVLNELVPPATRGAVCEDHGGFGSFHAFNRRIDYENVSIRSITRFDVAAQQVFVEWVKCTAKPQP